MANTWSRTDGPNGPTLSVILSSGDVITLNSVHPALKRVTELLVAEAPEAELLKLLNPLDAIAKKLRRLSTRVTTDGVQLYLDGDPLHDSLSDYILKLIRLENEGKSAPDWQPFVLFLEKLATNPVQSSRESLYDFITQHGLTIRANGDFIAYKGLTENYTSSWSGKAIVDSVEVEGQIPNRVGSIIEMPRSEVIADRAIHCAPGLHVADHSFASSFGRILVAVAVNPRDVVAVPHNGGYKIRVCRYEVLTEITKQAPAVATVGAASAAVWGSKAKSTEVKPSKKLVKRLSKAIEKQETLKVEYRGKKYKILPHELDGHLLRLTLADDEQAHRSFFISLVKVLDKKSSKKTKAQSPLEQKLNKHISSGDTLKLTLAKKKSKLLVKPRRITPEGLAVTLPESGNKFRYVSLEDVLDVKKVK